MYHLRSTALWCTMVHGISAVHHQARARTCLGHRPWPVPSSCWLPSANCVTSSNFLLWLSADNPILGGGPSYFVGIWGCYHVWTHLHGPRDVALSHLEKAYVSYTEGQHLLSFLLEKGEVAPATSLDTEYIWRLFYFPFQNHFLLFTYFS